MNLEELEQLDPPDARIWHGPLLDSEILGSCRCGTRWTGGAVCHCATCHMTFTSVGPFDKHRFRGRCRTADEMRGLGYEPSGRGQWRKPRPEESIPGHD